MAAEQERTSGDLRTLLAQPRLEELWAQHARLVTDSGLGSGYSLEIGRPETPVEVLVFPEARGVVVASETLRVELVPIIAVSRRGDRLQLVSEAAGERTTLELTRDGWMTLRRQALDDTASAESKQATEAREIWAADYEEPHQEPPTVQTEAQAPRVTLRGRVGRNPSFRTTPGRGTLVGQFPLAEHTATGETAWHTVVVFGARAERLRDKPIVTGQEIEIVAYPHERLRRTRGGDSRPVRELYATAIRTTLTATSAHRDGQMS